MKAAIYANSDGRILAWTEGSAEELAAACGAENSYLEDGPEDATHVIDGQAVILPPPPPSPVEAIAAIVDAVQRHLDNTARTRNYDGILSLASYTTSTDPVFRAEGEAGAAWRDACWRTCYQGLAEVQAGTRPMPTPEEAIAALPVMEWPTV